MTRTNAAAPRPIHRPAPKTAAEKPQYVDYQGSNVWLPRDGYLGFDVAQVKGDKFPSRLKLGDGRTATVERTKDGEYLIKAGKLQLLAVPGSDGRLSFVEPRPKGTFEQAKGDVIRADGSVVRPLQTAEQRDLAKLFSSAMQVAKGIRAVHLDPRIEQAVTDAQLLAQYTPTKKQAEALGAATARARDGALESTKALSETFDQLRPAIESGLVKIETDAEGYTRLALQRPEHLGDGEWQKLQAEFGPRLAHAEESVHVIEGNLRFDASARDEQAQRLFENLHRPEVQKYLSLLPPAQRIAEFNALVAPLAGTRYGEQLAKDLFGKGESWYPKADANGVLHPKPGLAAEVLKGAYDSPESTEALHGLAMSLAPHLAGTEAEAAERMIEVSLGHPLDAEERQAAHELSAAHTPEALKQVLESSGKAAEILGKLGTLALKAAEKGSGAAAHGAEAAAELHAAKGPLAGMGKVAASGAAVLALFNLAHAIHAGGEHHWSKTAKAEVASAGALALGSSAEMLHALGVHKKWLEVAGKGLGLASSAIDLGVDVLALGGARSPQEKRDKLLKAGASALVVGGTLVGGPVAAGVAIGALAFKIAAPFVLSASETYNHSYGKLNESLKGW